MSAEQSVLSSDIREAPHGNPGLAGVDVFADAELAEGLEVTVLSPATTSAESATIFVGGVLRTSAARQSMPPVPSFFGAVAARIAAHEDNPSIGIVFNWPGQGLSQGDAMDTSIDSRAELLVDIAARVQERFSVEKINFLGSCMGAYCSMVALDGLAASDIGRSVLLSPPAFPEEAHALTYRDGAFSGAISTDWQLDQSPAWDMVRGIQHPSLFTYFERDNPPIPPAIQAAYEMETKENEHIELLTIEGAAHNFRKLDQPYEDCVVDFEVVERTADSVADFLIAA